MKNPLLKTYKIDYTEIVEFNFQIVVFVASLIGSKKALTNVKKVMISNIYMPSFFKVWGKIEDENDPLISIESGKHNLVSLTEKELTEYLKMVILVDKVTSGRHFVYVKDELDSVDVKMKESGGPDNNVERGIDFNTRLSRILVRMAKIRWRNNPKFLAQIKKMESVVL